MQKYLLSDFYFAVNGAGFKRRKSILLNNSDIDFSLWRLPDSNRSPQHCQCCALAR